MEVIGKWLRAFALFCFMVLGAGSQLQAASVISSPTPFVCDGTPYTVINDPSMLQRVETDLSVTDIGVVEADGTSTTEYINGIGYNILDNYIYGISAGGTHQGEVIRLGSDQNVTFLGDPTPLSGAHAWNKIKTYIGTMDSDGNFYGLGDGYLYIVNITGMTYTTIALSSNQYPADITFNVTNGRVYGTKASKLYEFDITNGQVTEITTNPHDVGDANDQLPSNAGGAWSTSKGELYFYSNQDGTLTKVEILSDGTATVDFVGNVVTNGKFDATACRPPYVTKEANTNEVIPGGQITYEFIIYNPFTKAIDVNFTDPLPSGLTYDTGSRTHLIDSDGIDIEGSITVTDFNATDMNINDITLPINGFVEFNVTVNVLPGVTSAAEIKNTAYIHYGVNTSPSDDPDTSTPGDGTSVAVKIPDMNISKTVNLTTDADGSGSVSYGDTLTYTVTVENNGTAVLHDVNVSDTMLAPNSHLCATLAVNNTCVLTGTYLVTLADESAGTIANTGQGESNETSTISKTINTPVAQVTADLNLTKTVDNPTPTVGTNVTFTLIVANAGPADATDVNVTDSLPSGYSYLSSNGSYSNATGIWSVGNLNSGTSQTLTITASVLAAGNHNNTATVTANEPDPDTTDNNGSASTVPNNFIDAIDDNLTSSPVNGLSGGVAGDVTTNDTLNGTAVTDSDINITVETDGGLTGVTIGTDGSLNVPANTPAGTYTVTYKICEKLNPANCDTATVTVVVNPAVIDAVNDTPSAINGTDGGNTTTVLGNDTLNGAAVVPADITLTPGTAPTPTAGSITMNADGTITVAAGTTAGTYTYNYTICEKLNPTNCDTASVTVVVNPAVIDAIDDNLTSSPVNGLSGGVAGDVTTNDTLNGTAVTDSDINITVETDGGLTGVTIGTDGSLNVPANTPAGTYTVTYKICEKLNPANCDTATVTVVVNPAVIDAVNDTPSAINGTDGGNTTTVLGNDTLNGAAVVPADITLTPGTAPTPTAGSITMNADGTITVAAGTTAGTYTYNYTICEKLNPTNCDTASVTVVVNPAVIDAIDDNLTSSPVNGLSGGVAGDVTTNDTLNGTAVTDSDINITVETDGGLTGVTIGTDGSLNVPANTPAGTYTVTYKICEKLNPANCDTATVTVVVTQPVAEDDTQSTPMNTSVSVPVLNNDHDPEGDTLIIVDVNDTNTDGNVTFDANGTVIFTPDVDFTGTTTFTYTISDGNGGEDTATVAITVTDPTDPASNAVTAVADSATTDTDTPIDIPVLINDYDPESDEFNLTSIVTDPAHGTVSIEDNGTPNDPSDDYVTYTANNGFVGVDTFVYEVTDAKGNTDRAIVKVNVVDPAGNPVPNAVADSAVTDQNVSVTIDILANDSHPNNNQEERNITAFTQPANGVVTLDDGGTPGDPSDDQLVYTPNPGFDGHDTFMYTITDSDGDSASAAVTVTLKKLIVTLNAFCENDVPYISYDIQLQGLDPSGQTATATWRGAGGDEEIETGLPLSDTHHLWAGAEVDGSGNGTVWPGWNQRGDGSWEVIYSDWRRWNSDKSDANLTLTLSVNPKTSVTVLYPPATSQCSANPTAIAPPSVNDDALNATTGNTTVIDVINNDSNGTSDLNASTVQIEDPVNGEVSIYVVPGEGKWTVDPVTGEITFTPEPGYVGDPTPIEYTVYDVDGNSDTGRVTINYMPLANDDESDPTLEGEIVLLDIIGNDKNTSFPLDPTSVSLIAPAGATNIITSSGKIIGFTVPNEGEWRVDETTGEVTFDPDGNLAGSPTPIQYTVREENGDESNEAYIRIVYVSAPYATDNRNIAVNSYNPLVIDVLANSDKWGAFGAGTKSMSFTQPKYGSIELDDGGTPNDPTDDVLIYTPDPDVNNVPDSFTYTITDAQGNTSTAIVTLHIDCTSSQSSDGGDALGTLSIMFMMFLTLLSGLYFVRQEERGEA